MLHSAHWQVEDYKQRMTTKEWSKILLNNEEKVNFQGKVRILKCDKLGYGVVEVYKKPLC